MAQSNVTSSSALPTTRVQGMRVFFLIWLGQLVSIAGTNTAGFAQGVWVYQRTESVTQFGLISLFNALPAILFSPLAGALTDRYDRRKVLIFSDTGNALVSLAIILLLQLGQLEVWHIYVAVAVSSFFTAFHWPAYSAAMTVLVPKKDLGRANGMVQVALAIAQIVAPVLGGTLFLAIGLDGVFLLDLITFLFAVTLLLIVRIPRPEPTEESKAGKGSLLREMTYGWTYLSTRPGLIAMLVFFAITNFTVGIVTVLITPLALIVASPTTVGTIMSVGLSGTLVGSVVLSVWGGLKRRMDAMLVFTLVQGITLFLGGLEPSPLLLMIAIFVFLFSFPIISGSSQAIWQSKVAPDIQGRVFAIRRMIAWSSLPLAFAVGGPLADYVFEPLLAVGGPLAGSVGQIIGVGPGRGIGFLFIILGAFIVLAVIFGYMYPRLRLVEDELPDTIPDEVQTEGSSLQYTHV